MSWAWWSAPGSAGAGHNNGAHVRPASTVVEDFEVQRLHVRIPGIATVRPVQGDHGHPIVNDVAQDWGLGHA